jgi:hypothetical protein
MNSIQSMTRADFYLDVTRNGRFFFSDYNKAFRDAIRIFIEEKLGDEKERDPENFQWNQAIRDSLYNLIATNSPTITNGTVINTRYYSVTPSTFPLPTDYYAFVSLNVLIDSFTNYSRPTSFNELGPLIQDSFRHPTNQKTYYNETNVGFTVWRGTGGTFTSATLTYLRAPADFSVGAESQLIAPGGAVLTNGQSYIAVEISVQNSVTYQIGDQFTAVGTGLTSGLVILAANTVPIDLPPSTHEEIAKRAAEIMLLTTANYQASQAVESQVQKT